MNKLYLADSGLTNVRIMTSEVQIPEDPVRPNNEWISRWLTGETSYRFIIIELEQIVNAQHVALMTTNGVALQFSEIVITGKL